MKFETKIAGKTELVDASSELEAAQIKAAKHGAPKESVNHQSTGRYNAGLMIVQVWRVYPQTVKLKKGINMTKNLRCALGEHGFKATKADMKAKIAKYPYGHKKLQNVTTHHPQRFPWVWNDGKTYLFFVRKHVAAVIDGRTHDWSEGRAKRCVEIYEITKKEK